MKIESPTNIQERPEPWNLDSFRFETVDWSKARTYEEDALSEVMENDFVVDGKVFHATLTRSSHEAAEDLALLLESPSGAHIQADINCMKKPKAKAMLFSTSVSKVDETKEFPKATGIKIYEKLLEYIEHRTNEDGRPSIHIARRETNIVREEYQISKDRWNELFVPMFLGRGYSEKQGSPGTWRKKYFPQ